MRFLKGVILLSAVLVGVAVFYVFGSLVGFWGEIRSGVLARDGSRSPNVWPRAQEDGDRGASAYQRAKERAAGRANRQGEPAEEGQEEGAATREGEKASS